MTLHDYTPGDQPSVPDLPALPIGALVVGADNLLQQAAGLPQPRAITVYDEQIFSLEFDPPARRARGPSPGGRCASAVP